MRPQGQHELLARMPSNSWLYLLLIASLTAVRAWPPVAERQKIAEFRARPGRAPKALFNVRGEHLTSSSPLTAGFLDAPNFTDPATSHNSSLELKIASPANGASHFVRTGALLEAGTDVPLFLVLQWKHGPSAAQDQIQVFVNGSFRLNTTAQSRCWLRSMPAGWHNISARASVRGVGASVWSVVRVREQVQDRTPHCTPHRAQHSCSITVGITVALTFALTATLHFGTGGHTPCRNGDGSGLLPCCTVLCHRDCRP